MRFAAPIVGMAFRPPASQVLNLLPNEAQLLCRRQPENPYDENAIQVLLNGFSSEGQWAGLFNQMASDALPAGSELGRGQWTEELLVDPLPLGYVNAKDGFAAEIAPQMDQLNQPEIIGRLTFDMAGKPCVEIILEASALERHDNPETSVPGAGEKPAELTDDEIPF